MAVRPSGEKWSHSRPIWLEGRPSDVGNHAYTHTHMQVGMLQDYIRNGNSRVATSQPPWRLYSISHRKTQQKQRAN